MKVKLVKAEARTNSSFYYLVFISMMLILLRYIVNIRSLSFRRVKVSKKNLLVRAGGFDSKSLENLSMGIIFIIVLLAVGGFIVADLFVTLGSYTPSVSSSNPLYNATTAVVHGMQALGGLFSSSIGLITILIIIAIVSVVIALLRSSFSSGGTGT
ncbi:structural protein [Acidianus two-tailed virus 2]|nr:structural protein [Acidianus two-tailed virus 2]